MNTLIIGMTVSLVGNIMLGFAVIRVHAHIASERKVDGDVVSAIRREQYVAAVAVLLMIAGYVIEALHFAGIII